jgi:hypothetical protein
VIGAYVFGQRLAQFQAEGRELIGPGQAASTWDDRFSSEDFQVNIEERRTLCPSPKPRTQCNRLEEKESGKVDYRFERSHRCEGCRTRAHRVGPEQPQRS